MMKEVRVKLFFAIAALIFFVNVFVMIHQYYHDYGREIQSIFQYKTLGTYSNLSDFNAYKKDKLMKHSFSKKDLNHNFEINPNGSEVIVFLQIQKTGSTTMARHMESDFDVSRWCNCNKQSMGKCDCYLKWRSNILLKQSVNDWPCGTHTDWTHLQECAEETYNRRHGKTIKQRHLYVTMVRDPLKRYASEWLQVTGRGATWADTPNICNGISATKEELPPCYSTENWRNVALKTFMSCPSNLAANRQTRMLADLRLVNCYNTTGMSYKERHVRMLASARDNLSNMAYFGLTGQQELSQILFENTFNLKFNVRFVDLPKTKTYSGRATLKANESNKIIELNKYDVMLYQYAKDLFIQRLLRLAKTTNKPKLRKLIKEKTKDIVLKYDSNNDD